MPVNFGNTIFEGGITPEVQRQNPVQDDSGAVLAESLGGAFKAAGSIFGSIVKNQMGNASNGVLNGYRQDLLKLADAADQGMKPSEVRLKSRALLSQYIANNPDVDAAEFDKINSSFLGDNGFANVIKTGNETTQRQEAIWKAALDANAINPYDSPEKQDADVANYLNHQGNLRRLNEQVNMLTAGNTIVSEKQKADVHKAVTEFASTGYPIARNMIDKATADAQADPENAPAIMLQVKKQLGDQLAAMSSITKGTDIAWLTKPIEDQLKLADDLVSGKIDTDFYKGKVDNIKAKSEYALMADPKRAALIVASEALGAASPAVLSQMSMKAMEGFIDAVQTDDPTSPTNPKSPDLVESNVDVKKTFELATRSVKAVMSDPEATPGQKQEVVNLLISATRTFKEHSGGARGPQDYNELIKFWSDTSVGSLAESITGQVPAEYTDVARDVIRTQYEDVLLPLVREQLDSNPSISVYPNETALPPHLQGSLELSEGQTDVPTNTAIEIVFNGMGIEFRPAAGYENDVVIKARAASLNAGPTGIAQPINTLLRAKAHLGGSTDYKAQWDEIGTKLFPPTEGSMKVVNEVVEPVAPEAALPKEFDLSVGLADFSGNAEEVIADSGAANPRKMAKASSPIEAAKAYLGVRENNSEEAKVLSAFFKESAGIDLDPAKTAWCAAFVDSILNASGSDGTGKLNARSYLDWGVAVDQPKQGDIVVLSRGDPNGWEGHVGFYMGTNPDGTIKILGGNQGDEVSEDDFDADRVLGYRRAS